MRSPCTRCPWSGVAGYVALTWICIGGLGFALSILTRFHVLLVALLVAADFALDRLATAMRSAGAGNAFVDAAAYVLPPGHVIASLSETFARGDQFDARLLVWPIAFGVACHRCRPRSPPSTTVRIMSTTLSRPVSVDPASVEREVLPNGLTVLVRRDDTAPVVAIVTHVKAGYFDETDDVVGIAHVLEHMYFKGTPRRGVGVIAKETKASGGYLNASTIYDHTVYYTVLASCPGWWRGSRSRPTRTRTPRSTPASLRASSR